jgi:hypothetical protein
VIALKSPLDAPMKRLLILVFISIVSSIVIFSQSLLTDDETAASQRAKPALHAQ